MAQKKDQQRQLLLENILPHVPFDGWTQQAVKAAEKEAGFDPHFGEILFPGGVEDIIDFYARSCDQSMVEAAANVDLDKMRIRDRITSLVQLRISQYDKLVVKQTLAFYAIPFRKFHALQSLYKTVDLIWYLAGDNATDYNFYTKRLLLAGVYTSTLLYWIKDTSKGNEKSWDFLSRRIENVMQLGQFTSSLKQRFTSATST